MTTFEISVDYDGGGGVIFFAHYSTFQRSISCIDELRRNYCKITTYCVRQVNNDVSNGILNASVKNVDLNDEVFSSVSSCSAIGLSYSLEDSNNALSSLNFGNMQWDVTRLCHELTELLHAIEPLRGCSFFLNDTIMIACSIHHAENPSLVYCNANRCVCQRDVEFPTPKLRIQWKMCFVQLKPQKHQRSQ
ncbi:hypothetical protein T01_12897 [Trichinella spiralis]|uniref:Uncharacterized protein n=1 Tax=Trichinella spiralis TaxID=6334 RepID=A0A0V1BCN6_TRISP|nr:hypothetical protein T01_12897 [Trichinella spiralis]